MQASGYGCKVAKNLFSPLCIGVSHFCALVCFMGFLIKTHKASVVYDMKGYAWI